MRRLALCTLLSACALCSARPGDPVPAPMPTPPPAAPDDQIDRLVNFLRDEFRGDKAMWAFNKLKDFGERAKPALERALSSNDWHQRQLAANCLCHLGAEPSEGLIKVCVEGLKDDTLPEWRPDSREPVMNARDSVELLIAHIDKAEAFLAAALNSEDEQQRFLAAFVLGYTTRTRAAVRIVEILAPHLRDNLIDGDALLSGKALYRLGPAGTHALNACLAHADIQQHRLIQAILRDITLPPKDDAECLARAKGFDVRDDYRCDAASIPHVQMRLDQVWIGLSKPHPPSTNNRALR